MRPLILVAALALALPGCAHASFPPTQLPPSATLDDKLGVAVETTYEAATLAVRSAIAGGFVSPEEAAKLAALDNQAYSYVCYTRTAYDLANGSSPAARKDGCPAATKSGTIPAYAEAAQAALAILKDMVQTLASTQTQQKGAQ